MRMGLAAIWSECKMREKEKERKRVWWKANGNANTKAKHIVINSATCRMLNRWKFENQNLSFVFVFIYYHFARVMLLPCTFTLAFSIYFHHTFSVSCVTFFLCHRSVSLYFRFYHSRKLEKVIWIKETIESELCQQVVQTICAHSFMPLIQSGMVDGWKKWHIGGRIAKE